MKVTWIKTEELLLPPIERVWIGRNWMNWIYVYRMEFSRQLYAFHLNVRFCFIIHIMQFISVTLLVVRVMENFAWNQYIFMFPSFAKSIYLPISSYIDKRISYSGSLEFGYINWQKHHPIRCKRGHRIFYPNGVFACFPFCLTLKNVKPQRKHSATTKPNVVIESNL